MISLCFYCSNARADRCKKILDGTPINGWIAKRTECGGCVVKKCPKFKHDKRESGVRTSMAEIARLCGCSERNLYRFTDEYIKALLKKSGYKTKIVRNENNRREFYLIDERV